MSASAPSDSSSYRLGEKSGGMLDAPENLDEVRASQALTAGFRCRMHSIAREWLWIIPDRVSEGETLPHIPVECVAEPGVEAAKRFVNIPADNYGGTLDAQTNEHVLNAVIENSGAIQWQKTRRPSRAIGVNKIGGAEGSGHAGIMVDSPQECLVESWEHEIILMQKMHPVAPGPSETRVPISREPKMLIVTVKRNGGPVETRRECGWIKIR